MCDVVHVVVVQHEWQPIEFTTDMRMYSPSLSDVGHRLKVCCTPVCEDGTEGKECECITAHPIAAGMMRGG